MNTKEFLEALKEHPGAPLVFLFESGKRIPEGYHITEIKNIHIESVDCGGAADHWNETVIQLWLPANIDPNHDMSGAKALKILTQADQLKPMNREAVCLFEVEEESGTAVIYRAAAIEALQTQITIHLTSTKTQCKANDRAQADPSAVGCCGPSPSAAQGCCG